MEAFDLWVDASLPFESSSLLSLFVRFVVCVCVCVEMTWIRLSRRLSIQIPDFEFSIFEY